MDWKLLVIPGTALARALFGWIENALDDGIIDLPEWKKLGATVIRMGVPIVALVWALDVAVIPAAGIITLLDIVITKIYNASKKKK